MVGANGVVHESIFNEEKTADSLFDHKKKMYGRMYGGTRNRSKTFINQLQLCTFF